MGSRWTCVTSKPTLKKVSVLHKVDVATRLGAGQGVNWGGLHPSAGKSMDTTLRCDQNASVRRNQTVQLGGAVEVLGAPRYPTRCGPGGGTLQACVVERDAIRAAMETYSKQEILPMTLVSVREAVFQVSPVMNQLSFTKGFTPAQLFLNSNPATLQLLRQTTLARRATTML